MYLKVIFTPKKTNIMKNGVVHSKNLDFKAILDDVRANFSINQPKFPKKGDFSS